MKIVYTDGGGPKVKDNPCPKCKGTGVVAEKAAGGDRIVTCPQCGGSKAAGAVLKK